MEQRIQRAATVTKTCARKGIEILRQRCVIRGNFFHLEWFLWVGTWGIRVRRLCSGAPFVVREADPDARDQTMPVPHDIKFQLVEKCYVEGLMQGQAVRDSEVKRDIILI